MQRLAASSRAAYRSLVYETPGFVDVFYALSPIEEISSLRLGSRPAKRVSDRRIEHLRAIPWTFAWNQNRILLPSWYGWAQPSRPRWPTRRTWPVCVRCTSVGRSSPPSSTTCSRCWLRPISTSPAATRPSPSRFRAPWRCSPAFGRARRDSAAVLAVTGSRHLLAGQADLLLSISRRNPYIDRSPTCRSSCWRANGRHRAGRGRRSDHPSHHQRHRAGLRNTG